MAPLNTYELITKTITVKGSNFTTLEDLKGGYELMKTGELNPPVNLITYEEIPQAIEHVRAGGVVGRYVVQYEG